MAEIILSVIFTILMLINLRVFLYQRTVRKISMKTGIKQEFLLDLYPKSYITQYRVSKIRWLILIVLIFFNWVYALVLLLVSPVLYIIVPEQDDIKNMKMMLVELEKYTDKESNVLRNKIGEILNECGEDDMYRYVGVFFDLYMTDNSINKGLILNISEGFESNGKVLNRGFKVRFENEVSINNRYPSKYYTLSSKELDDIIQENLLGSYVHFIYQNGTK